MHWWNSKYAGNAPEFNDDRVIENLYSFLGDTKKDYLLHGVTENEFLERLNPEELEEILKDNAYSMIRRKTFDDARVLKKWQIIVDATELDEGYLKKNNYYLSRCYNCGEDNEFTGYHRSVLEAKLYLGNDLVCSIASETIENSEEYISQSEERVKQDCESKAFTQLKNQKKISQAAGHHNSRRIVCQPESTTDMQRLWLGLHHPL